MQKLPRRLNRIHSPPQLVPERRRHLPFIQQARPRPSQHQGRIHRQRLGGGEVYIQEHRGGGQLLGQARLAAGFGTLDHHCTGGAQAGVQFGVGDVGDGRPKPLLAAMAGRAMQEMPGV